MAFDGLVEFFILTENLGSDLEAQGLERRILEAVPDMDEDMKSRLQDFTMLIAHTDCVEFHFDGREKRPLKEFQRFWEQHTTLSPEAIWAYRLKIPYKLLNAWRDEYRAGQQLFDVDPAQLPLNALTPAQREEAADPASPLANGAEPSTKTS